MRPRFLTRINRSPWAVALASLAIWAGLIFGARSCCPEPEPDTATTRAAADYAAAQESAR